MVIIITTTTTADESTFPPYLSLFYPDLAGRRKIHPATSVSTPLPYAPFISSPSPYLTIPYLTFRPPHPSALSMQIRSCKSSSIKHTRILAYNVLRTYPSLGCRSSTHVNLEYVTKRSNHYEMIDTMRRSQKEQMDRENSDLTSAP